MIKVQYRYTDSSIKIAPHPFSEGSQRISYFGIETGLRDRVLSKVGAGANRATVVLKSFRHHFDYSFGDGREDFLNMVETQSISDFFARRFNSMKPPEVKEIHFLDVKLVEVNVSLVR